MYKLLLSILLLFSASLIFAQSTLRGNIKDEKGEAIIAATIKVGTKGAVSDLDGNYELRLDAGSYIIECSYVGYDTQKKKIEISNKETQTLDFQLSISQNILNQLTVTSGRYEKKLSEVTVSMDVLKPDLIERNNTQTIDNVLQKVPGVNIIGGQPNIRGGSGFSYGAGSRVLILVDDIPALQADAGFPNWNDFQIETIEQVEVVKGAASALYGSSALNGVVNIRTAYAKDKPLTTVSTFFTSYRDPQDERQVWYDKQPFETGVSVTHRQKIKKLDLVLGTNWRVLQSFNQATNDSIGRFTIGTRYRISDRFYVGFNSNINIGTSNYFLYWKGGGADIFRANTSNLTRSKKTRYTIDPFISYHDKYGNRHKLLGRFYSVENQVTNGYQNASDLYYSEYQFQRDFGKDLIMTSGLVVSGTYVKAELYGNQAISSTNIAPYFQIEKKIGRLSLSGGARYERNRVNSADTVWILRPQNIFGIIPNGKSIDARPVFRLGANYKAADFTYLRASFGQGYRYPTIAEKFISSTFSGLALIPNDTLTSETGFSAELGLKQGFKIGNFKGFLDVAGFWTEYQNMMEFQFMALQGNFAFQSQNIGNTRINGIEATVAGQGNIGDVRLSLLTGYTYIQPRYQEFGQREKNSSSADYNVLKYRFIHTFKLDAQADYKNFGLGFSSNYNSKIEAIDKIFYVLIPGVKDYFSTQNKGVMIYDIRASYSFLKYYKLSFLLKNVTNVAYALRPALMEAPRNVNVRLDVKF